jgi:5'-phosphate synthase pdxT subunit
MSAIGVLALQGAFDAHRRVLAGLGHPVRLVRTPTDLEGLGGLVLPGGESTVQLELLTRFQLEAPLSAFIRSGAPVLATCAGLILVARAVSGPVQRSLGLLDVAVARNAWGRQVDSFEDSSDGGLPLVFIRAPRLVEVGAGVTVLDRYRGEPVIVRQGNLTAATFHPELVPGPSGVHRSIFGTVALDGSGPRPAGRQACPADNRPVLDGLGSPSSRQAGLPADNRPVLDGLGSPSSRQAGLPRR